MQDYLTTREVAGLLRVKERKIYELVSPEIFEVLAAEARAAGMPIASHVPLMMTADSAGPLADSMEHLRNLELACAANWEAMMSDLSWLPRESGIKNHHLWGKELFSTESPGVMFEKRPILDQSGNPIEGLFSAWIILNNPRQYNSYTTEMVKAVIAGFHRASADSSVVAAVFTAMGDKAFCTGGNTKEYAEYYAGRPEEYRQYMRLFNDMVSAILGCDKPVICRVNGMRIAGGQEIGMACDFSVAQDLARFGQAGPKHGSAAIGGSTDFLPVMIGCEQAMVSGTLCEPFSAHKAQRRPPG